jgi:hypothetical protein
VLDPEQTPIRVLEAFHRRRRQVELEMRHIQTTLGMERLRCRTQEKARKELWVHLLADNLIRLLMAQAALPADQIPRRLGLEHTVQVRIGRRQRHGATDDGALVHRLLLLMAQPRVGRRPDRLEPRRRKRRNNRFPLMTKFGAAAREAVRLNGHAKKQR